MKKIVVSVAISVLGIFILSYFLWIAASHQIVAMNPIKQPSLPPVPNTIYKNNTHDFSLIFPKTWDNYDVIEQTNENFSTTCFSFQQPQPFCIFNILKLTNNQWNKLKQEKNILLKTETSVFLCDGCCKQSDDMSGGGQFNDFQSKRCGEASDILETFKIINNKTVDWKIYNAQNNFLTFKYPVNLEKLMSSKQFSLSINSKQEIINTYKKFENGGCPSICGRFVDDPSLLQKQFEILEKISTLPNCAFSITEKEDIKNNFILFSGGINNKYHIEGIKIKNNTCGLKIIESDGFDVSLSNIHYKVSMFINNKVINISFPMYPHSAFADVDNLWAKMDFDSVNYTCGPVCIEKETEYFNKFNVTGSVEKQVVEAYDQIIATLNFID